MQWEPRGDGGCLGRSKPGEWAVTPQEAWQVYSKGMLAARLNNLSACPKSYDNMLEVFIHLNACLGVGGCYGPSSIICLNGPSKIWETPDLWSIYSAVR